MKRKPTFIPLIPRKEKLRVDIEAQIRRLDQEIREHFNEMRKLEHSMLILKRIHATHWPGASTQGLMVIGTCKEVLQPDKKPPNK